MTKLTPKQQRAAKLARQRINVFSASYPDALQLARYAAFPLSLTPELLYVILENSDQFADDELADVPWYSVSDVLLSGLCDRVGYGLYEMSAALRVELLQDLRTDRGDEQIEDLGDFMASYIRGSLAQMGQRARLLGDRPQWTVLACLNPDAMLQRIKADLEQLWKSSEERDRFHWSAMLETYGAMLPGQPILKVWADQLLEGQRPGFVEAVDIPDPNILLPFEFDVVVVDKQGHEISRQQKSARYFVEPLGEISAVGVPCLEMVEIPGGEFLMGSLAPEGFDRERPQHQVQVPPFFIGKYQVTQAQWRAVVAMPKASIDLKLDGSSSAGDNLPVKGVSWLAAQEFCQRVTNFTQRQDSEKNSWTCRLPSEAEWEYACRAGTTSPFHFGETITAKLANYDRSITYAEESASEYRNETTVVGSFKLANNFGLYDMHGNVWEWCADHWHDNYQNAPIDGSIWGKSKDLGRSMYVLRGGSWFYYPDLCRSAFRDRNLTDNYFNDVGFRVVYAPARTL